MVEPSTDVASEVKVENPQILQQCEEKFIPESSLAYQP